VSYYNLSSAKRAALSKVQDTALGSVGFVHSTTPFAPRSLSLEFIPTASSGHYAWVYRDENLHAVAEARIGPSLAVMSSFTLSRLSIPLLKRAMQDAVRAKQAHTAYGTEKPHFAVTLNGDWPKAALPALRSQFKRRAMASGYVYQTTVDPQQHTAPSPQLLHIIGTLTRTTTTNGEDIYLQWRVRWRTAAKDSAATPAHAPSFIDLGTLEQRVHSPQATTDAFWVQQAAALAQATYSEAVTLIRTNTNTPPSARTANTK
jgi:hypothetical protein